MALANQNIGMFERLIASPSSTAIQQNALVDNMELYRFCTFKIAVVLPPEEGGKISEKFVKDNLVHVAFYNLEYLHNATTPKETFWYPYLRKRVSYTIDSKEKSSNPENDESDSKERIRAGSFFYPSIKSKVVVAFVDKSFYNGVIIGCIADNHNTFFYNKPNTTVLSKDSSQSSGEEKKLIMGSDENGKEVQESIGFVDDAGNSNPKYYMNSATMGMEINSNKRDSKNAKAKQKDLKGSQINFYKSSDEDKYSNFIMMDADKEAKKSLALNFSNIKLKADNIKMHAEENINVYSGKDVNVMASNIYDEPISSDLNTVFEMKKHADPDDKFSINVNAKSEINANAEKNLNIMSAGANFNPKKGRLTIEGRKVAIQGDKIQASNEADGCTHHTTYMTKGTPSVPVPPLPTKYKIDGEIVQCSATVKSSDKTIATVKSKVEIKHNPAPDATYNDVIQADLPKVSAYIQPAYVGPVSLSMKNAPQFTDPGGNHSQTVFLGSGKNEAIVLADSLVDTCDEIMPKGNKKGKVVISNG